MLVFRYLCREVLGVTLAILVVMLLILLVSQSALYLDMIARGLIAYAFLGKLIMINIPFLLGYILPFAFYFGLLLGYGRLYAESEMVVLQASGFSGKRLLASSLIMAFLVTLIAGYLLLYLNPMLIKEKGKILLHSSDDILQSVVPESFRVIDNGKMVIYVGKISHDHKHLNDIFVAQLDPASLDQTNQLWTVNFIDNANQIGDNNDNQYLQTSSGFQYKGTAGQGAYSILKYDNYNLLLTGQGGNQSYDRLDGAPTLELWKNRADLFSLSELEWRFSLVFQVFVLTLFAVPLSRVRPRQGRYAKFLPAVIFYTVFANLLFFGRFLLENKYVNQSIGMSWVFVLILLIVGIYYLFDNSLLFRKRG